MTDAQCPAENLDHIQSLLDQAVIRHGNRPQALLQILRDIQAEAGQISATSRSAVAERLGVPLGEVLAVTEFYGFLSTGPRGDYDLRFSDSITDHLLGSRTLLDQMLAALQCRLGECRADGRVTVDVTSCTGLCDQGPAALINGRVLTRLTSQRVAAIVAAINAGIPLAQWPADWFVVSDHIHQPGLLLQTRQPPGAGLAAAIQRGRSGMLDALESAGLRGRGGAGFPTHRKWRFCHAAPGQDGQEVCDVAYGERVVVCNADEGEPGTFKDRVLLARHLDQVLEGMTIAAFTIGANQGFLYIRGEYAFLAPQVEATLARRRAAGLLGRQVGGLSGFNFDIAVHWGAGAYICGEESALIESLEGRRGIPRNRPPFPVTHGYLGRPTVVNNVETLVAAALIAEHGGAWFAAQGTPISRGSKILSISGDVARPGIYEFPFGITLDEVLAAAGAESVQAVQVGGPSGALLGPDAGQRRIAFEDLATGGSLIVFNQTRDLLDVISNFTSFFHHESCGFCTPCRCGTAVLDRLLQKVAAGHGTSADLVELQATGVLMKQYAHCGLGQTAANPLLDGLARFPLTFQRRLTSENFVPAFDLDGALTIARDLSGRTDPEAYL